MISKEGLSNRQLAAIAMSSVVSSIALRLLGDDAWRYIPPAMFLVMVAGMSLDGGRPLTLKWVLLAAAVSLTVGAVLGVL